MPRRKQTLGEQSINNGTQHPIASENIQVRLPIHTVLLIACNAACRGKSFDDVCEIAIRDFVQPSVEQTIAHIIRTTPIPTFPHPHIPTLAGDVTTTE